MAVKFLIVFSGFLLTAAPAAAQKLPPPGKTDSTFIFGPIPQTKSPQKTAAAIRNSWGIDILASTNGFGAGAFYRREYSNEISAYVDFSISEAKDDNEVDYVDYYGNTYTPGKVNRFLIFPLFLGVEKRMFADDIMDNFRPFLNAAVGPTVILVFPYNQEYFSALGKGTPKYTVGGYLGLGAFFGSERSGLFGLNVRYYFVPYPKGLASMQRGPDLLTKKDFGGLYITLCLGTAW